MSSGGHQPECTQEKARRCMEVGLEADRQADGVHQLDTQSMELVKGTTTLTGAAFAACSNASSSSASVAVSAPATSPPHRSSAAV